MLADGRTHAGEQAAGAVALAAERAPHSALSLFRWTIRGQHRRGLSDADDTDVPRPARCQPILTRPHYRSPSRHSRRRR